MYDKYSKLVAFTGTGKRVLDVGCADGYLSGELLKRENEVIGVEIDPRRAARARHSCGLNVIVGDICRDECWQQIRGDFDVVIFSDVLEHVLRPQQILMRARQALRPQGYVLISLPNVAYFRVRLQSLLGRFDYTEEGILDKTHVHFYTLRTSRQLIESCNYAIVDLAIPSDPKTVFNRVLLRHLTPRFPNFFGVGFIFRAKPNGDRANGSFSHDP